MIKGTLLFAQPFTKVILGQLGLIVMRFLGPALIKIKKQSCYWLRTAKSTLLLRWPFKMAILRQLGLIVMRFLDLDLSQVI